MSRVREKTNFDILKGLKAETIARLLVGCGGGCAFCAYRVNRVCLDSSHPCLRGVTEWLKQGAHEGNPDHWADLLKVGGISI